MKSDEQQNYINELNLAAEFQQAVLPDIIDVNYLDIAVHFEPYDKVSGDVYDFKLNRERELSIFVGDATGHGISSALMTMMVHIAIDSLTPNLPTDESIRKLNQIIASRETGRFVTGVFFRISPDGLLSVTHAGHPSILIQDAKTKTIKQFDQAGCPLGLFQQEPVIYQEETYSLQPGDRVIAYTDGLTEIRNKNNQPYGVERLLTCLQNDMNNTADAITHILNDIEEFTEANQNNDDVTLLSAIYTGVN